MIVVSKSFKMKKSRDADIEMMELAKLSETLIDLFDLRIRECDFEGRVQVAQIVAERDGRLPFASFVQPI